MAQRALATAFVNVVPSLEGFNSSLKGQLGGTMGTAGADAGGQFNRGFGGALSKIGTFITTALATGAIANFTKSLIDAGEQEIAGNARLTQIAQSMGLFGAEAENVSQRLSDLAGQQQLNLGIDDDTIKLTQAKLLTFKNLAQSADEVGGYFDRATTAALDLAAAGFGSAETNAVQLGKALQDPVKGITALARSGVTFTAQEKDRIKTLVESNKIGEAQALILQAIETQVGGTAAATATSSAKMAQGFAQVQEEIGLALLPTFQQFAGYVTSTVIPAFKQFIADFKAGKTPLNDVFNAVSGLIGYIKDNWTWISTLGVAVLGAVTAFKALQTAIDIVKAVQIAYATVTATITGVMNVWKIATGQATVAQLGLNAAMLLNPIGLIVAAIAALIAGLVYFFTQTDIGKKAWADFTKFLGDAWNNVAKFFGEVWTNIQNAFKAAIDFIVNIFMNWSLWGLIVKFVGYVTSNWDKISKFFVDTWNNIMSFLKSALDFIVNLIVNWSLPGMVAKVVRLVVENWDKVVKFFRESGEKIIGFFADAGKWLMDAGKNIIQGLIDGAGQMAGAIGRWISGLADTIMSTFKNLLGIKSPSRVFREFGINIGEGLANGIEFMVDPVTGAISRLGDAVTENMDTIVTDLGGNMLNISEMVNGFNSTIKTGMAMGKGFKEARDFAEMMTGGSLQSRLDAALGSTSLTNKSTGMSVTIGAGLDPSVMASMVKAYLDAGFTYDQGTTIVYNAAPNNSLDAEQELIKAVKVARLV